MGGRDHILSSAYYSMELDLLESYWSARQFIHLGTRYYIYNDGKKIKCHVHSIYYHFKFVEIL